MLTIKIPNISVADSLLTKVRKDHIKLQYINPEWQHTWDCIGAQSHQDQLCWVNPMWAIRKWKVLTVWTEAQKELKSRNEKKLVKLHMQIWLVPFITVHSEAMEWSVKGSFLSVLTNILTTPWLHTAHTVSEVSEWAMVPLTKSVPPQC